MQADKREARHSLVVVRALQACTAGPAVEKLNDKVGLLSGV